jgi:hypothetical protein
MFSDRSRYRSVPTDRVQLADGRSVTAVRFPVRMRPPLAGYHRVLLGQRLDHIAAFYFKDPAGFWLLCDANGARSPHALEASELIGIPRKAR